MLANSGLLISQSFRQVELQGIDPPFAGRSNGVAVADYDSDGDLDIYIVAVKPFDLDDKSTWNTLLRNDGDCCFVDVTVEAGLAGKHSGPSRGIMGDKFAAVWGDYDNDGFPDLFITNLGANELYHNEGNGHFTDVTASTGVAGNPDKNHSSAVWWDFDLDGDLDLYVCAWQGRNQMFENINTGERFVDITDATGLGDTGQTWVALPIDANGDRRPDLYVVNDYGNNQLYLNMGRRSFQEVTNAFGLANHGNGMGVTLGDCDNDGLFDIYLTNISIPGYEEYVDNPLFIQNSNGFFVDKAVELSVNIARWGWGTEFFDYDHDGDLDLYVVNGFGGDWFADRNIFFENLLVPEGFAFSEAAERLGVDGPAEARGLVVFDRDNDGDLDILVPNFADYPDLYLNDTAAKNWLQVQLLGTRTNRNGVGAVVKAIASGYAYFRIHDGVEFLGQSIQPLHFGLGDAELVDTLTVSWPGGRTEAFYHIEGNQKIMLEEGRGEVITKVQSSSESISTPEHFVLLGNYPNPFNGATTITFVVPEPGMVTLIISDMLGAAVNTMSRFYSHAGQSNFVWNGTSASGSVVASGFYIYQLDYQGDNFYGKLLYLK
jgi:hypothetical protein